MHCMNISILVCKQPTAYPGGDLSGLCRCLYCSCKSTNPLWWGNCPPRFRTQSLQWADMRIVPHGSSSSITVRQRESSLGIFLGGFLSNLFPVKLNVTICIIVLFLHDPKAKVQQDFDLRLGKKLKG